MRLGLRDLVLWSFLMASAHGAGLMLVPALLRLAGRPARPRRPRPGRLYPSRPCRAPRRLRRPRTLHALAHPRRTPGTTTPGTTTPGTTTRRSPDRSARGALPADAGTLLPVAGAAMLHTLAMLLAMGLVAGLVYERLGVGVLRRAWLNLDRVWAGAILAAGVFTLLT